MELVQRFEIANIDPVNNTLNNGGLNDVLNNNAKEDAYNSNGENGKFDDFNNSNVARGIEWEVKLNRLEETFSIGEGLVSTLEVGLSKEVVGTCATRSNINNESLLDVNHTSSFLPHRGLYEKEPKPLYQVNLSNLNKSTYDLEERAMNIYSRFKSTLQEQDFSLFFAPGDDSSL